MRKWGYYANIEDGNHGFFYGATWNVSRIDNMYIAGKPSTEPLETIICNVIPMTSIALGLVFGWLTGGEYEG